MKICRCTFYKTIKVLIRIFLKAELLTIGSFEFSYRFFVFVPNITLFQKSYQQFVFLSGVLASNNRAL